MRPCLTHDASNHNQKEKHNQQREAGEGERAQHSVAHAPSAYLQMDALDVLLPETRQKIKPAGRGCFNLQTGRSRKAVVLVLYVVIGYFILLPQLAFA